MPTAKKSTLETYLVVVDAVNVTNGRKPNGSPAVVRLVRGERLEAPADNLSVVELLSLNSIVLEREVETEMRGLAKGQNPKAPRLKRPTKDSPLWRVTGTGVAAAWSKVHDPALPPQEDVLPMDGAMPDLTPVVSE